MNRNFILISLSVLLIIFSCSAQKKEKKQFNQSERIQQYLSKLEKSGFSGSVLAAKNGTVIRQSGHGFSDQKNKFRNTPATVYDIGSITKQFTAAAILKLEMNGKLTVEDLISTYFKNVPDDKKDITIHQLLTHSSGFPGAIGDDYEATTNQGFVDLAMKRKLEFTPGSAYEYSNVGYSLLALIIEQVSGQAYEAYLNKNLFKPSGMNKTGYRLPTWDTKNIAIGYSRNEEWGKPNAKNWASDGPYLHLKGNGGILSTVEDMYKWHKALLGTIILSESAKQKMYTKHVKEGEDDSYYGYGWAIFPTSRNTELIAHNGGNGIFFADFWRYLEEGVTIIMMTNAANRKFEQIPSEIAQMIRNDNYTPNVSDGNGESDELEVEMIEIAIVAFDLLQEGEEKNWKTLLNEYCTQEFKEFVPIKDHYDMLGQIQSAIQDGSIKSSEIDGNEVIFGIQTGEEMVELILGFEKVNKGVKIGSIMFD